MVIATEERTAIDVAGLDIGQAINYPPAPWIPGTEHRADCAVGQLRPERMMPCSTEINPWIEPWPRRNLLNDRLQLCRQHQAPDYNVIPPWISGTSYRADCAVGQLRPTGMMPCSDEPLPRANDQDGERRCRQHSYPTWQRCIILAEECFGQSNAAFARGRSATREWEARQHRNAGAWFQRRAGEYRRAPLNGRTSDVVLARHVVEWEAQDARSVDAKALLAAD